MNIVHWLCLCPIATNRWLPVEQNEVRRLTSPQCRPCIVEKEQYWNCFCQRAKRDRAPEMAHGSIIQSFFLNFHWKWFKIDWKWLITEKWLQKNDWLQKKVFFLHWRHVSYYFWRQFAAKWKKIPPRPLLALKAIRAIPNGNFSRISNLGRSGANRRIFLKCRLLVPNPRNLLRFRSYTIRKSYERISKIKNRSISILFRTNFGDLWRVAESFKSFQFHFSSFFIFWRAKTSRFGIPIKVWDPHQGLGSP